MLCLIDPSDVLELIARRARELVEADLATIALRSSDAELVIEVADGAEAPLVLEVAPGVEVRYLRRAIMEVIQPGDEPEDEEPEGYYEDAHDEEDAGTPEDSDGVKSADEGLTDSHEDLAKSDKDNVH